MTDAPADKEVETVDEIWNYAMQPGQLSCFSSGQAELIPSLTVVPTCPGFLFYLFIVTVFAVVMIYKVAPTHGKKNPIVYTSICSVVGSISVMAIKVSPRIH